MTSGRGTWDRHLSPGPSLNQGIDLKKKSGIVFSWGNGFFFYGADQFFLPFKKNLGRVAETIKKYQVETANFSVRQGG